MLMVTGLLGRIAGEQDILLLESASHAQAASALGDSQYAVQKPQSVRRAQPVLMQQTSNGRDGPSETTLSEALRRHTLASHARSCQLQS